MKNFSRYQSGFTLIEVMIVIFILAIISAIAIPGYMQMISRHSTKKGASDIVNVINEARSQAALSGKNVNININANNRTYSITYIDPDNVSTTTTEYILDDRLRVVTNMPNDLIALPTGKLASPSTANLILVFRVCDSKLSNSVGNTVWINSMGIASASTGPTTVNGDSNNIGSRDCSTIT